MEVSHLSFSSLSLWAQCQGAWWAKYVDKESEVAGEAARFGSAFDQAISKKLGLIEEVKDTSEGVESAVMFYQNQPWAWKQATAAQKEIKITPAQWATMAEMIGAESEIHAPIIGYIDLMRMEGITKKIVDLKTSSRAGWRSSWGLQLLLYILAENAQSAEIHLITTLKKGLGAHRYIVNPTPDRLRWCMETLGCYAKQIAHVQKGDPLMRCGGYWCEWCPEKISCVASAMENIPEITG